MKINEVKERSLIALWWLMVGGAAVWLLAGSVAYWVKKGWLPVDTSGWVQAFGSIGAIFVAIGVNQWQNKTNERIRRRRECHYIRKAFNASAFAHHCAVHLAECFEVDNQNSLSRRVFLERLKDAYEQVCAFSYASLADLDFANSWQTHKRVIQILMEEIETHPESKLTIQPGFVSGLAGSINEAFDSMAGALDNYSARVGESIWSSGHP